jgi:hypothetical protein
MDMFGGLTKTSSRIAIAAALGMTLGGFAMSATPAKAADLGGDCCADLEERVAELEATTVRKGNKKVSVTLSGWVVKLGSWWDDGHEQNVYFGDKDTTLSSHFQISGSATIAPGWSAGYTIAVEVPGTSCATGFVENQFNDNACAFGDINTLLSYMWIKSDRWGTTNWGQLSQATDNVALLPDLSGTVIESNAVLFDGAGMFLRPKGARNSNDLASDFTWGQIVQCIGRGGGVGADCAGYPYNGVRYDSPTWAGFSVSTGYYEDDVWDVAVKYAADWNSIKVSAAAGFTQLTDEGCSGFGNASCGGVVAGGGGTSFQGFRRDAQLFQVGASILHVPTGLFAYGLWQREENDGTQWQSLNIKNNIFDPATNFASFRTTSSDANESDVFYVKAGIKRAWMPAGATVLFGEWGQYNDEFSGLCGNPGGAFQGNRNCLFNLPTAIVPNGPFKGTATTTPALITGSEVNRWGLGIVQEIDSAAMHVFARWQHLEGEVSAKDAQFCKTGVQSGPQCGSFVKFDFPGVPGDDFSAFVPNGQVNKHFGKSLNSSFQDLDIFQVGGVIFF